MFRVTWASLSIQLPWSDSEVLHLFPNLGRSLPPISGLKSALLSNQCALAVISCDPALLANASAVPYGWAAATPKASTMAAFSTCLAPSPSPGGGSREWEGGLGRWILWSEGWGEFCLADGWAGAFKGFGWVFG